jgi:hypothetical protein
MNDDIRRRLNRGNSFFVCDLMASLSLCTDGEEGDAS